MAVENLGKCLTFEASADLSTYQYRFVKTDANGQIELCGDGEAADGILQNKPAAAGRAAQVALPGCISKVVSGAVVAKNALVASDANGRAVTAVSGDYILGKALEAAGAADVKIAILFQKGGATL
jgi:hypothetical protein